MYVCNTKALTKEVHICTSGISRDNSVKFVYKGHLVKVKVTGAKKLENPYSFNVKLPKVQWFVIFTVSGLCGHT